MIQKCADTIADWMIRLGTVEKTDKDLYQYALYCMISFLSPLFLAIMFGVFTGSVRQSMVIVLPFMVIRKFSGGYHTKHAGTCLIWSCLLLFLCTMASFYIRCEWSLALATLGAAVSLIVFSPIDNENRVLSQEEHCCYKRVTAVLAVVFLTITVLLYMCNMEKYSVCISIGMILSAGLQLPCICKKLAHYLFSMEK